MKIGNSLDWYVYRVFGTKFDRGNNCGVYIGVGTEVLNGYVEVVV